MERASDDMGEIYDVTAAKSVAAVNFVTKSLANIVNIKRKTIIINNSALVLISY